jgi:putative spermidine/putrescine transport system permease protein
MSTLGSWVWGTLIFLLYLFLLAPLLIIVVISFNDAAYLNFPPENWSFRWYEELFTTEAFVSGFRRSMILATLTTIFALAIGVPAAWAISRFDFPGRGVFVAFFTMPLMVPGIILGLGMLLVFSRFNLISTYPGLIAAHLVVTLPFVIRIVGTSMLTLAPEYEEAALSLGATPRQAFWHVTLPLVRPGIIAGSAIAFLTSFDEVVLTLFLVGTTKRTLPVEIFSYVQTRTDPLVAALSVVLVGFSIALVFVIERSSGLRKVL